MGKYSSMPAMPSCNSCGDCCTQVSARPEEVKRIRHYVRENGIEWQPPSPKHCGFLRVEGDHFACAVYEVRPWACRAYGTLIEMACPFFPEDASLSLPAGEARKQRLIDPEDKLLGEAFGPPHYLRDLADRAGATPEVRDEALALYQRLRAYMPMYGGGK